MFVKNGFKNVDEIKKYRDELFEKKKNDNSIIEKIYFENLDIKKNGTSLEGITFSIKDNFAVEDYTTSAASKIIREFRPNYTSTVFRKLVKQGAVPLFKANLDELAMGGTGLTSNYGPVYNPFNKNYLVGGSSSGSNYLVSDKSVDFSIGSDTGDSIRKPASWTGIVGFKPTWGLVSRYGMYDFAPSWDTVGWFTNSVKDSSIILDVLKGFDPNDNSSLHSDEKNYFENIELKEKYKISIIKNIENYILDEEIRIDYHKTIELLKKDNHTIKEIELDFKILETINTTYKIISSVEAFSCNSNLTGFHFGSYFNYKDSYDESISNARTKGLGYEVKKRFLYAQEAMSSNDSYYFKALKMRRKIRDEINRAYIESDVLLVPSTPNLAPNLMKLISIEHTNILNNILTVFNAAGNPSISIPITKNGHRSTSVNISSLAFSDIKILKMANKIEEILND